MEAVIPPMSLSIHLYLQVFFSFLQRVISLTEVPSLYYMIDAGPTLGLFLDILLPLCILENLQAWVSRSIHIFRQLLDAVKVVTIQTTTLGLGLGSCRVGSPDEKSSCLICLMVA